MAYTKSPDNSTYKSVNLDFTATSWYRSGTYTTRRDAEVLNMFFDRNSNENQTRTMALTKRPGYADTTIDLQKGGTNSLKVNGYFYDATSGNIYWAIGNNVYSRTDGGTITNIATMASTNTSFVRTVGFTLFLTSAGTRYLCFTNGTELWYHVVGAGTSTKVTDVDFPSPIVPSLVFLDGYLFVAKASTGDIYNSDLDTPINWTAGNYATAEINSDSVVALAKVKNYLIAFGREGIEFFYDAANVSGSPLGRNESYYHQVALASTVETIGDTLFFVGRRPGENTKMFALDGNNLKEISVPWVNRYLQEYAYANTLSSGFAEVHPFSFTVCGHTFLAVSVTPTGHILVYDVDENIWYKWTVGAETSTSCVIEAVWPAWSSSVQYPLFAMGGSKQYISSLRPTTYQDFSSSFTCSYTTEDYDADTFNWKSCHRMGLYCDYPDTGGTASTVSVSWSDDDGNTFSTARDLTVTSNNPYITQCGRFRSRNWRIAYADNYPFRMWGLTMDLNVGNI